MKLKKAKKLAKHLGKSAVVASVTAIAREGGKVLIKAILR